MLEQKESYSESAAVESEICSISDTGSIELRDSFQKATSCRGMYLVKDAKGNMESSMDLRVDPLRGGILFNQKIKKDLIATDIKLSMGKGYSAFTDDVEFDEDKDDFFLFRQPQLYKSTWETKPQPYRQKST